MIEQQKQIDEQIKICFCQRRKRRKQCYGNCPVAGGDEAALFARELMNMYIRLPSAIVKRLKFRFKRNRTRGLKEASFIIKGKGAYSRLKFESGVHRVQRVPETEAQGRIHTSTCTVAVCQKLKKLTLKFGQRFACGHISLFRCGRSHVNKQKVQLSNPLANGHCGCLSRRVQPN